jgi:thiazole synthase
MEMGCAAVLVNTAVAAASNPPAMADAFAAAVEAGRMAYLAGIMSTSEAAVASSPLTAFLRES